MLKRKVVVTVEGSVSLRFFILWIENGWIEMDGLKMDGYN